MAERTIAYAMLGFLTYVVFNSGVHENHWFIPSMSAFVLASLHPVWWRPAIVIALIANVNLLMFYGVRGQRVGEERWVGFDPTVACAALAIGAYAWTWLVLQQQEPRYRAALRDVLRPGVSLR